MKYLVLIEFFNILSRIWGGVCENLILVAIPMFIFMGTMLEKSGVAKDLLYALQILLRRVPGGLSFICNNYGNYNGSNYWNNRCLCSYDDSTCFPVMLERNYDKSLSTGTIAASGTLGILIPPSIMLVIMADLLAISVGTLFVASVFPGLLISSFIFYLSFLRTRFNPKLAPPLPDNIGPEMLKEKIKLIFKSFLPPIFLIF